MKHGSFKVVCLILMACIAVLSAFGDEYTVSQESKVLETFWGDGESGYEWRVLASKYATKTDQDTFPKLSYVSSWPMAVYGRTEAHNSLGIHGRFDRQGYNWIDIYPVAKGGAADAPPAEIPIPGRVQSLDMWVWGSNLRFTIEAYIRDYRGIVYTLPMGSLAYSGWKDLRAVVPSSIAQSKRILPSYAALGFVKFRIWTLPTEMVGDFYIYFNQLKILTDTFNTQFDGDELADPTRVQELWSGAGSNAGSN